MPIFVSIAVTKGDLVHDVETANNIWKSCPKYE